MNWNWNWGLFLKKTKVMPSERVVDRRIWQARRRRWSRCCRWCWCWCCSCYRNRNRWQRFHLKKQTLYVKWYNKFSSFDLLLLVLNLSVVDVEMFATILWCWLQMKNELIDRLTILSDSLVDWKKKQENENSITTNLTEINEIGYRWSIIRSSQHGFT